MPPDEEEVFSTEDSDVKVEVAGETKRVPPTAMIGTTLRELASQAGYSRFKAVNQDGLPVTVGDGSSTFAQKGISLVSIEQYDKGGN